MNYCRRCGAKLTSSDTHVFVCANNHTIYANASPCTAVIIINSQGEVLTITRSVDPGKGKLDLPGGFCDGAETLEACAYRELEEETGITPQQITPLIYFSSGNDRYNYADEEITALTAIFTAHCNDDVTLKPGDDAQAVTFIPIDRLDPNDFCFDSLQAIIPLIKQTFKETAL